MLNIAFAQTMKYFTLVAVLFMLLNNYKSADCLSSQTNHFNYLGFKAPIGVLRTWPILKYNQPITFTAYPTTEVYGLGHVKSTNVKVCQNGMMLNHIRTWRHYCSLPRLI